MAKKQDTLDTASVELARLSETLAAEKKSRKSSEASLAQNRQALAEASKALKARTTAAEKMTEDLAGLKQVSDSGVISMQTLCGTGKTHLGKAGPHR